VRVNAIAPDDYDGGDPPEWEQEFVKFAPLKKTGTPEDCGGGGVVFGGVRNF